MFSKQSEIIKNKDENEDNNRLREQQQKESEELEQSIKDKFKGIAKSEMELARIVKTLSKNIYVKGKLVKDYNYIESLADNINNNDYIIRDIDGKPFVSNDNGDTFSPLNSRFAERYLKFLLESKNKAPKRMGEKQEFTELFVKEAKALLNRSETEDKLNRMYDYIFDEHFVKSISGKKYTYDNLSEKQETEIDDLKSFLDADFLSQRSSPAPTAKEYIVWGIPKGKKDEELLLSTNPEGNKLTKKDAEKGKIILQEKYGATNVRIQEIDLAGGFDFSKEVVSSTQAPVEEKNAFEKLQDEIDLTENWLKETGSNLDEEKIKMNNLDWGKTTAERNKNLDHFDSLKTDKEKENFKKKLKSINEGKNDEQPKPATDKARYFDFVKENIDKIFYDKRMEKFYIIKNVLLFENKIIVDEISKKGEKKLNQEIFLTYFGYYYDNEQIGKFDNESYVENLVKNYAEPIKKVPFVSDENIQQNPLNNANKLWSDYKIKSDIIIKSVETEKQWNNTYSAILNIKGRRVPFNSSTSIFGHKTYKTIEEALNGIGDMVDRLSDNVDKPDSDSLPISNEEQGKELNFGEISPSSKINITESFKNQNSLNDGIVEFIEQTKDRELYSFTDEEKEFIYKYEGSGGLKSQGASDRGVLTEFYTPEILIKKMWGLAFKYGFNRGKILENSVGIGRFLDYIDFENNEVDAYEIKKVSARICKILHPKANVKLVKSFAEHFYGSGMLSNTFNPNFVKDYDLVIGNPPYGAFNDDYMEDELATTKIKFQQLEFYFTIRSLDCLKSGGLLVYVVPANIFNHNGKYNKLEKIIESKAEIVDAYKLPESTFKTTKIATCIIVLRKK